MNITLNIQNSDELRAEVKSLIKGQVDGMVRSDFHHLVLDELKRMIPTISSWEQRAVATKVDKAIDMAVTNMVNAYAKEIGFSNQFISDLINKKLEAALAGHDWKNIVDAVAKEKIKAMVQ